MFGSHAKSGTGQQPTVGGSGSELTGLLWFDLGMDRSLHQRSSAYFCCIGSRVSDYGADPGAEICDLFMFFV